MENTKPQIISFVIALAILITITALKFVAGNAIGRFVKGAFGCLLENLNG